MNKHEELARHKKAEAITAVLVASGASSQDILDHPELAHQAAEVAKVNDPSIKTIALIVSMIEDLERYQEPRIDQPRDPLAVA